jgi:hypothetical protein
MWNKYLRSGGFDCNIVFEAWIIDLEIIITPFREEFWSIFETKFG